MADVRITRCDSIFECVLHIDGTNKYVIGNP